MAKVLEQKLTEDFQLDCSNYFQNSSFKVKLDLSAMSHNIGISERIVLHTFTKNYQSYDTPLLIDGILNITERYISKEAVRIIHAIISKLVKETKL